MKFGLFHSVQLPDSSQQERYYREALEQVLHAEKLGYSSVWFTEHHFTRHGIVSATFSVLSYLAAATNSMRLGTAVTVLPFHNPVQLAEQTSTLDVLSNGRLDLGVGRGYQWGEFHRMGIPMNEATRRFEEGMEVLTRSWTATEPFDHRGEFWSFNDLTVQPRPVQKPHPPVYVAASGPESLARVVRNDWNLLIGQAETQSQVADQVRLYQNSLAEADAEYTARRVVVARAMHCASSTEQARREAEIPFTWFRETGQEVSAPPERRVELLPDEFAAYRSRYTPDARFDFRARCEDVMLFGSPDHIAGRIGQLLEAGVEKLIFFVNFGGIEHQRVLDSLALFASEVMPQFSG